jgi:hypothetical protein
MDYPTRIKWILASVLSFAFVLVTVPRVEAVESVFGRIQVSGPAWVASDSADWSRLSSTRPLVAGDRLKTGSDGYLLADLGEQGVIGLYGDAEVTARQDGESPSIEVHKGKVAFHLAPDSKLNLNADGAGIHSQKAAADGYVEYGDDGVPVVVVEEGSLNVQIAGVASELSRGQKMALKPDASAEKIQLAGSHEGMMKEDEDRDRDKAGGWMGGKKYGGLSIAGWTALGVVGAATGGAVASSAGSSSGSSASPSGGD